MGDEQAKRSTIEALTAAAPFLRRQLTERIAIRRIPILHFLLDEEHRGGSPPPDANETGDRDRIPSMTRSGILNVNKEPGWTSFQVVALVRNGSGIRKVGHAGTLDPAATGVLLVCLGQATRVSEYLMELPKTYQAQIVLGIATDTYDADGRPLSTGDLTGITEDRLSAALLRFVGDIQQVPPSFSAVKVDGQPAHRLARKGQQPTLKARSRRIDSIDLLSFAPPVVEIEVPLRQGHLHP